MDYWFLKNMIVQIKNLTSWDFQHMMYDTVITQTTTYDRFVKTYFSNYKNIKTWNKIFNNFKLQKIIKTYNTDRSYYAIYKK